MWPFIVHQKTQTVASSLDTRSTRHQLVNNSSSSSPYSRTLFGTLLRHQRLPPAIIFVRNCIMAYTMRLQEQQRRHSPSSCWSISSASMSAPAYRSYRMPAVT